MKEFKTDPEHNWDAWFWLDREEFEGEWKIGLCRYRVKKAVGRDTAGRLFLMVWTNHDKSDRSSFTQAFYEIDMGEYTALLDRAIAQGEVGPAEREELLEKAKSPFIPPWDIHRALVVYQDERYALGQRDDRPYLIANGRTYRLSCHPYEPCLYITEEDGNLTAVHNAFDPFDVLERFHSGETITSITGREYDAKDFCEMVAYAAGMGNIGIDDAERVFGGRAKKKAPDRPAKPEEPARGMEESPQAGDAAFCVLTDARVEAVLAGYPALEVEYCIVQNGHAERGEEAHRCALLAAFCHLSAEEEEGDGYRFDLAKAQAKPIGPAALFAPADDRRAVNYRGAFRYPPHGGWLADRDFGLVNAALFPNGTNALEVFEWTTDWSDFFDDGHEWWGALCDTVYDNTLDRFVVILASSTD